MQQTAHHKNLGKEIEEDGIECVEKPPCMEKEYQNDMMMREKCDWPVVKESGKDKRVR